MTALEPLPGYPDHEAEITINRAEVMGVMGMYTDALLELRMIDSKRLSKSVLKNIIMPAVRATVGWLIIRWKNRLNRSIWRKPICIEIPF